MSLLCSLLEMVPNIDRNENYLIITFVRYQNSHVHLKLRCTNIRIDTRFYIFVTRFDLPNSPKCHTVKLFKIIVGYVCTVQ